MTTAVTLNGKRVLCDQVLVGGTKSVVSKPNANVDGPIEAQTLAYENLRLTLQGVHFPFTTADLADTTIFHYSDALTMYKSKYTGANAYTLIVVLGKDVDYTLAGLSSTAGIPVVMESFNLPLSAKASKNAYMPSGSLTLRETL